LYCPPAVRYGKREIKTKKTVSIGIIGDFDRTKTSHPATNNALRHAADHLGVRVSIAWIPTPSLLAEEGLGRLEQFDGLWASSGSPYQSAEGALRGIRRARELGRPFIGT
jgi:CTP synthase (UTP-ammonia lyase)